MPGKKDYASVSKGVHKQKQLILCNFQKLHTAFKEKQQNANFGFSKFCTLILKWCVLTGSKGTNYVCVCSAHQNTLLLVDGMDFDLTYKVPNKKIVYKPGSNKCMMHQCESYPATAALKEFLDQELKRT